MTQQFASFTQLDLRPLSQRGGSIGEAFRSAKATGIVTIVIGILFGVMAVVTIVLAVIQLITEQSPDGYSRAAAARISVIPGLIGSLVLLGVAVFLVVRFFRDGFRKQRMQAFADANGLRFVGYQSGARLRGIGFNARGDARWHEHVAIGMAQGHQFELGNFQVAETRRSSKGNRRTSTVVKFAYLAIRMPIVMPHTFFDATENGSWRLSTGELKRWDLEGHFPTQFRTFTVPCQEREMLEIMSPDVMQVLSDHGRGYDIELTGDFLVLLRRGATVTSPDDVAPLLAHGSAITAGLDTRIREWHRG